MSFVHRLIFLSRLPMSRALVRGALAHPPNILVVFVMMPCEEGLRVHDFVHIQAVTFATHNVRKANSLSTEIREMK